MNVDELRALYTEAVKIVRAERKMRLYVFRDKPDMMEAKLREIDRLLVILEQIKDAAKAELGAIGAPVAKEQATLIDVPRKYE